MSDESKLPTAEEATAFLSAIENAATLHNIPPHIAVGLFGLMTKAIINEDVENGTDYAEAMIRYISHFMDAVGVETMRLSEGDDGGNLH